MVKKILLGSVLLAALTLTGCVSNDSEPTTPTDNTEAQTFNFATTKTINLNVKYDVASDYQVMFKVYSENPYKLTNGSIEIDPTVTPIASGFTSKGGSYSGQITIPSAVEDVYVYSYYVGVPSLLKTSLNNGTSASLTSDDAVDLAATFSTLPTDASASQMSARTLSSNKATADQMGYTYYTTWDKYGRIDAAYRTSSDAFTSQELNIINQNLVEARDNSKYAISKDFYVNDNNTEIVLNYVGGTTAACSTLCYYIYKGTTPPSDPSSLRLILIFPDANANYKGVVSGDAVKLKFYDPATGVASDVFPAGYSVGFAIINGGGSYFAKGTPYFYSGKALRYSTKAYNSDGITHAASFNTTVGGSLIHVLSFEDWTDVDYNDVIFAVKSNPVKSIDNDDPTIDNPDEETYTTTEYKGITAFEDLWPNKGDFDLNDVVVKYDSKVTIGSKDNGVVKTVDTYTLLWTGAAYDNDFRYEIPGVKASDILSCTVEGTNAGAGLLNQGTANNAVIEVFKGARTLIGRETGKTATFTVTTVYKNRAQSITPPYNPFIVPGISPYREVHFVDFTPSSLFTDAASMLGTHDDLSVPASGYYYRTSGNYPFAILMPGVTDLGDFLNAKYEAQPINVTFPKYNTWVTSGGTQNKDWYNYPVGK
ncbi:MAG: LruC domain-containing protein [Muribaculaceae bacterium]|jgi:LruC domain-containing protein|nr:LruC domain-containing protein [Muribaculaceae bacterium]